MELGHCPRSALYRPNFLIQKNIRRIRKLSVSSELWMLEHERGIDVDLAGADGRAAEEGSGRVSCLLPLVF
jgi:hypothetical protein